MSNLLRVTPLDLIKLALKDAQVFGVGQTPLPENIEDAFLRMNMMLAQWQRKRWLIWTLSDYAVLSTGNISYTIGPNGDINIPVRPDRIEAAYLRQIVQSQPSEIDYPLELIQSKEDYSRIALKWLGSFPRALYYDPQYPVGVLYPWPVPVGAIYETHVLTKEILAKVNNINQAILLPPEYLPAIEYNLAVRLAPAHGQTCPPEIIALAKDSLNVLRTENTQVGVLQMPPELVKPGIYNPFSDQSQ